MGSLYLFLNSLKVPWSDKSNNYLCTIPVYNVKKTAHRHVGPGQQIFGWITLPLKINYAEEGAGWPQSQIKPF